MKQHFLLFGFLILLFSACKKDSFDATLQAKIDDDKIQAYVKANHIEGLTKDASGMYYQIITVGPTAPGTHPTATDTVQVTYTGKLLNGTVFDAESGGIVDLPDAIKGWQIGLPLIGADGVTKPYARIRLIIPSALGYANVEQDLTTTIPANSVLDFTIDLIGWY
jgi:FKBP-type peptidyl-prolyl cis-trans isomerase FkpA